MSRIDELIAELCPGGVELTELRNVVEIRSGWGFPNAYQGQTEGTYPFYKVSDMNIRGNELLMTSANNYLDKKSLRELGVNPAPAGTVIFPKIGAAVATNKKRLLSVDSAYDNNVMGLIPGGRLVARFLFYWMQTINLISLAHDSGAVPSIRKSEMESLRMPVPPLEVQREIVKVLDTFTELEVELEVELEAELEARRQQYEYYRDALLSFDRRDDMRWATLGELAQFINAKPHEKLVSRDGEIALMTSRFISTEGRAARFVRTQDVLTPALRNDVALVMSDLPNGKALAKAFFVDQDHRYAANQRVCLLRVKDGSSFSPRFLYYVVNRNKQLLAYDSGVDQTHLKKDWIVNIQIPMPSLEEQLHIVSILDKFTALVNDLTSGLPAEITARRQQYAYYRDRLLSFKEAA